MIEYAQTNGVTKLEMLVCRACTVIPVNGQEASARLTRRSGWESSRQAAPQASGPRRNHGPPGDAQLGLTREPDVGAGADTCGGAAPRRAPYANGQGSRPARPRTFQRHASALERKVAAARGHRARDVEQVDQACGQRVDASPRQEGLDAIPVTLGFPGRWAGCAKARTGEVVVG